MPAIQPARLKQQAALLAEHFGEPAAFVRSMHYLLDYYSDRAIRPGYSGKPKPLTKAYKVRPPVLRQLLQELSPLVEADPPAGLALCDALWHQDYLEFRLLASMVLGQIPPTPPDEIINRLNHWIGTDLEAHLTLALLNNGLVRTRQEHPQSVILLAKKWFQGQSVFHQQLGLRLLSTILQDPDFENLPAFFRILQPLIQKAQPGLRPDLLDVLAVLALRTPHETAFFLKQCLELPDNPDTAWIIRQSLSQFPPEVQIILRQHLRSHDKSIGHE